MNTPALVGNIVEHWQKFTPARTVVYAVDVKHSINIRDRFRAAGIPALHIDGQTGITERAETLKSLRDGCTKVVCNVMVLTEGWDLPALDCAVIARPTASLALHLQMLGRIMRTAEGKASSLVLDHAGNVHRLGLPTQQIDYSLDGKVKPKTTGFKTCEKCGCVCDVFDQVCPECSAPFGGDSQQRDIPQEEAGELVELNPEVLHETKAETFRALEQLRISYGFKEGWAAHRFKSRFGQWPLVVVVDEVRRLADPRSGEDRARVYRDYLGVALSRGFRKGWAAHQYRSHFGVWPRFSHDLRERFGIDAAEEAILSRPPVPSGQLTIPDAP